MVHSNTNLITGLIFGSCPFGNLALKYRSFKVLLSKTHSLKTIWWHQFVTKDQRREPIQEPTFDIRARFGIPWKTSLIPCHTNLSISLNPRSCLLNAKFQHPPGLSWIINCLISTHCPYVMDIFNVVLQGEEIHAVNIDFATTDIKTLVSSTIS